MKVDARLGVLIFHPANVFGGAERTLMNLLMHIDRERYRVVLVASGSVFSDPPVEQFIPLAEIGLSDAGFSSFRASVADARRLVALARLTQCRVLLGMLHYGAIVAGLCAPLSWFRLATIASPRTPSVEGIRLHVGDGKQARRWYWMVRLFCRFSTRVLVASEGLKQECVSTFHADPRRVRVVANAVDDALLEAARHREVKVRGLASVSRPWLIFAVGRLAPEKDLSTLIRAMGHVRQRLPVRLDIVGDGPERPCLEALVAALDLGDVVRFTGFSPRPFDRVCEGDLFVHTALFEGFGNVILEAMACGVPLIASDCDFGPREIVEDRQNGRLVPPLEPTLLADTIVQTLADARAREAYARMALVTLARFSAFEMARGYQRVFSEVGER